MSDDLATVLAVPSRRQFVPAAVLALSLAIAGCGSKSATTTKSVPPKTVAPTATPGLTDAQALVLGRVLQRDDQDGGAHFTGDAPFNANQRVVIDGEIDWKDLRGSASVKQPDQADNLARKYFWTKSVVLAQDQIGSKRYQAQKPDPDTDPMHFVIEALGLLTSENLDNVAVLRDQGARVLRRERVGDRVADVYAPQSTERSLYWIDIKDGRLLQVQLDAPRFGGTATLRFSDRGPKRIALPPKKQWITG